MDEHHIDWQIVFVGFLIGGLTWGIVCDVIGRKRVREAHN